MIEMLRSKTIIAFVVIILGVTFISTPYNTLSSESNNIIEVR